MADSVIDSVIKNADNDERPVVKWGKLASSILGIVSLGWFYGIIGFVEGMLSGVASGLGRAESWVSGELITVLFGGVIGGIEQGWIEFEQVLTGTGILAPLIALFTVAAVVVVFIWVLQTASSIITGAI